MNHVRRLGIALSILLAACTPEDVPPRACAYDAGYCVGTGTAGFECCPTAEVEQCAPQLECRQVANDPSDWRCQDR